MPQRKLLVADDSLTIQKVIRLALSSSAASGGDSYEIQAVSDGDSALQQISLFRPEIVLVDVNLPGKNAIDLKREIDGHGDEFRNLRFILLSSAFEKLDEAGIEAAGFQYRLSKPFDPAHLRQVLATVGATLSRPEDLNAQSAAEWSVDVSTQANSPEPEQDSDFSSPPPAPLQVHRSPIEISLEPPHIQAAIHVDHGPEKNLGSSVSAAYPPDPDEDIRQLTQETLRQVGSFDSLTNSSSQSDEDSEWSVQEHATLTRPSSPPSFSTSRLSAESQEEFDAPTLPPLSPDLLKDFGDSDFPLIREIRNSLSPSPISIDFNSGSHEEQPPIELGIRGIHPQTSPLPPPPAHADVGVAPLSVEQMEAILAKQLEASIQEMARKLLPDLAERIIKEEIHRMLQQQP